MAIVCGKSGSAFRYDLAAVLQKGQTIDLGEYTGKPVPVQQVDGSRKVAGQAIDFQG